MSALTRLAEKVEAGEATPKMKRFIITIDGYDGCETVAETASKARWTNVIAFQEAFGKRHMDVGEILSRMSCLHLGPALAAKETI